MALSAVCAVVSFAVFAAISFIQFRHFWLAVVVALAPWPGALAARFVVLLLGPHIFATSNAILTTAFGLIAAQFVAAAFVLCIAEGEPKTESRRIAIGQSAPAIAAAFLSALGIAIARFLPDAPRQAMALCIELTLSMVSAVVILLLALRLLRWDENVIARVNRAREWRERMLERIAVAAFPRWGFTIFGISLVFVAMAFFGARATVVLYPHWVFFVIVMVFSLIAAAFVTRDWRRSLAASLTFAWIGLIGLWANNRLVLQGASLTDYSLTLALCLMPLLLMAAQHRRFAVAAEAADGAGAHAMVTIGSALVFGTLGLSIYALIWAAAGILPVSAVIMLASACAGTLLLQPATSAVLELLIRRRVPLDARYKLS